MLIQAFIADLLHNSLRHYIYRYTVQYKLHTIPDTEYNTYPTSNTRPNKIMVYTLNPREVLTYS